MDDRLTSADTDTSTSYQSLTSFYRSGHLSSSAFRVLVGNTQSVGNRSKVPNVRHDFMHLLAVCETRQIDFLAITWDRLLDDNSNLIGLGVTSNINPGLLKLNLSFAFKRLTDRSFARAGKMDADERRHHIYQALISEVSILGHPVIREHKNIIRLEGVCWDYLPNDQEEKVRPVLVFEKAEYGDLLQFSKSSRALNLTMNQRLALCSDIVRAVAVMHSTGE